MECIWIWVSYSLSTGYYLFYNSVFLECKKKMLSKISLVFIALLTLGSFLLLLQRFDLVIAIVLSIVFFYYGTNKFRARNVIIISLLLITFMYSISTVRVSSLFIDYLYLTSKMKFSPQYAFLTEPYMYVVMNLENFANVVNNFDSYSFGYFTFDFILALTGLKHWIAEYAQLKDFPELITAEFNTYTMFLHILEISAFLVCFYFHLGLG